MEKNIIKTRLILFTSLLATVIILVVLYASGVLRFGLSQQFTYILYSIAGLLAAVTCFGLLSSFGKVNGQKEGVNFELGGAIVAFVVVTGGGAVYEKYFHTPEVINMTILFVTGEGQQQDLTGVATLYAGTEPKVVQLKGQSDVTFQGISNQYLNKPMNLTIKGNFEIANPNKLPNIENGTVKVEIKPANPYTTSENSNVAIVFEDGSIMNFGPDRSKKSVVLTFRLYSQSEKVIPLSNEVLFKTLSNSAIPIYSETYRLEDPLYLQPKADTKVILDILVPSNLLEISYDKTAVITFFYNKTIQNVDKEFSYDFDFSKKKLKIF